MTQKELIDATMLTCVKLAEMLGVPVCHVYNWRQDKCQIPPDHLVKINEQIKKMER
jgi:hypothetical protein